MLAPARAIVPHYAAAVLTRAGGRRGGENRTRYYSLLNCASDHLCRIALPELRVIQREQEDRAEETTTTVR